MKALNDSAGISRTVKPKLFLDLGMAARAVEWQICPTAKPVAAATSDKEGQN